VTRNTQKVITKQTKPYGDRLKCQYIQTRWI